MEVAEPLDVGAAVVMRGCPPVRATVLAAGGEAERRLTGQQPRGVEADEAELDGMSPCTAASGHAETRRLVAALSPYVEARADVIVEYHHLAGATAIFMALLVVHGEEGVRRPEALLSHG